MLTTALLLHTPPEKEYFFDEGCYILELSNTTHDADVSIAQARVKPGVTTHWHYLLDVVERYVILSGHGVVDVDNLTAQEVSPGSVVLIPAGCRQRISNHSDEDLIFLAICSPRFTPACYHSLS